MSATITDVNIIEKTRNITESINKPAAPTITNTYENNVDAPELASLLQCMGFSLQSFEQNINGDILTSPICDAGNGCLKIDITCSESHMKATLIKKKGNCKCPSKEHATNAQFWNISACSPSLPGNVTVSKSSLIPTISAEKSKIIHALLVKALDLVNSNVTDENTENFADLLKNSVALTRHRSLEILKSDTSTHDSSKTAPNNENFKRDRISPRTSSPIPQLSSSSKQDTEKACKLIEAVKSAHKLLSDALDLASNKNTTFTKRARRMSDLKISPLSVEDQKSGSELNVSKPDSSCCKTPKKPIAPKKIVGGIGDKKKYSIQPSKLGVLKPMKSGLVVPKNNLLGSMRDSSSSRDKSMKLNVSGVKSKIGVKNDTPSRLRIPLKIASLASTSAKISKN